MKVGILGGGQLARMLALDGFRMGLDIYVLCGNIQDPAAQVCPHSAVGNLNTFSDVERFLPGLTHLTVESEFIDTKIVEKALPKACAFEPSTEILATIQDRLTQKQLLENNDIPTAPFTAWNCETPPETLFEKFSDGFVVKKRRYGYDGYGTFVFQKGQTHPIRHDAIGYIAEEFIPFKRELAFSIARNANDEMAVFPLVESKQVNSRCFWVKGPVKHPEFEKLSSRIKQLMKQLDYRGILAVELFDHQGELIVNELAPRVHNSAHYSMNGLTLSQFEAHWRGVLNWPLQDPDLVDGGFAMVNLLGDDPRALIDLSATPNGWLHWYGKQENRSGRKMGHLNTIASTADEALEKALSWRKGFKI